MVLPEQQLLQQGLDLMIYGMATVFLFLTLLVSMVAVVSALIGRFCSETVAVDDVSPQPEPRVVANRTLLAVLQKAIDQHRRQ